MNRKIVQPIPLQRAVSPVFGDLLREIRPHQLGPRLKPGIVLAPDDDPLKRSVAKGAPAIYHQLPQLLQTVPARQQRRNGDQAQAPRPSVTPLGAPEATGSPVVNIEEQPPVGQGRVSK